MGPGADKFGRELVSNMAGGIANAATRSLINGSDFGDNLMAALPDIIGQTVGGAVAQGVAARANRPPPLVAMPEPYSAQDAADARALGYAYDPAAGGGMGGPGATLVIDAPGKPYDGKVPGKIDLEKVKVGQLISVLNDDGTAYVPVRVTAEYLAQLRAQAATTIAAQQQAMAMASAAPAGNAPGAAFFSNYTSELQAISNTTKKSLPAIIGFAIGTAAGEVIGGLSDPVDIALDDPDEFGLDRKSDVDDALSTNSRNARAIAAETAGDMQNWRAHHVVPFAVVASLPVNVQKAIVASGWRMDSVGNVIALPGDEATYVRSGQLLPIHRGPHPNYSAEARTMLGDLTANYASMSPDQIHSTMRSVQAFMTERLMQNPPSFGLPNYHPQVR